MATIYSESAFRRRKVASGPGPPGHLREPGRTLANGDVLRIDAIRGDGSITVRRAIDRDPATGQRRWTQQAFAYRGYSMADLGYAVTGHAAQGRTVTIAIPLVTGAETRQWLYSAMTRGGLVNIAHVFTRPARLPDPGPGTRPAPELARHERLQRERDGLPSEPSGARTPAGPT